MDRYSFLDSIQEDVLKKECFETMKEKDPTQGHPKVHAQ